MELLDRIKVAVKALVSFGVAKNQEDLGRLLGYTNKSSFSQVLNGKVEMPKDFVDRLCGLDDRLEKVWVAEGIGPVLKSSITYKQVNPPEGNNKLNEPNSRYGLDIQRVPIYRFDAEVSMVSLFKDRNSIRPIDFISIPNLPKCDGAVYVKGDGMAPLLKGGDIVIYKELPCSLGAVFLGEMYLLYVELEGEAFVTLKYLHPSTKGDEMISLVSENGIYQSKEIHFSSIKAMALVKASIRINSMS